MQFPIRTIGPALRGLFTACLLVALASCASPVPKPSPAATGTGWVAAANPHAVDAGLEVLRNGGSAVDAAIAVQTMLGLVTRTQAGPPKTLLGTLAWGMDLPSAIELPNLIARGSETVGEHERFPPGVVEQLARRGLEIRPPKGEESGLHGVWRHADGTMIGGADSRREGTARSVVIER